MKFLFHKIYKFLSIIIVFIVITFGFQKNKKLRLNVTDIFEEPDN